MRGARASGNRDSGPEGGKPKRRRGTVTTREDSPGIDVPWLTIVSGASTEWKPVGLTSTGGRVTTDPPGSDGIQFCPG